MVVKNLQEIYNNAKNILQNELEAREICALALGINRNSLIMHFNMEITDVQESEIDKLVKTRLGGKPLAYILGEWEFYSITFKVNEDVLIPRADTETLVDNALNYLNEQTKISANKEEKKILDLCAGSGCIGIAIGENYKNSNIIACDISKKAINIAKENALINKIKQYTIYEDNVLKPKIKHSEVDLIVSNPPYIKKSDIEKLDIDVRDYEPHIALNGGEDGLIFYEKICENYNECLKNGGKIIFEYGIYQEDDIKAILEKYQFENIKITKDLCGINRIIEATKCIV